MSKSLSNKSIKIFFITLCDLYINLSGAVNSKINFQTAQFKLRNQYLLYGINQATEDERVGVDLKLHYEFVSNESANYVGLANTYQKYLLEKGLTHKKTNYNSS